MHDFEVGIGRVSRMDSTTIDFSLMPEDPLPRRRIIDMDHGNGYTHITYMDSARIIYKLPEDSMATFLKDKEIDKSTTMPDGSICFTFKDNK